MVIPVSAAKADPFGNTTGVTVKQTEALGTEPIGKLLFRFSIPAMIGMGMLAVQNIIDRIYIGQGIGDLALSAIGVTFPLFTVMIAVVLLIGVGSGALASIRLGEGKKEDVEQILGNTIFLAVVAGLILTITGQLFMAPLLRLVGASDSTFKMAKDYYFWINLSMTVPFIGIGLNNLIRAEGNPKIAMVTLLIGPGLNIILDPIFIFALDMGVSGVAIATVLSNLISTTWVILHFTSKRSVLRLRLKNIRPQIDLIISALAIGLAPFSLQLAISIAGVLMNNALLRYGGMNGDFAIGAMTAINTVAMVVIMPIIGIAQGAQPVIGFNKGAGHYSRVKQTVKLQLFSTLVISGVALLTIQFFPNQILGLFSKNADGMLVEIGSRGMRIFLSLIMATSVTLVTAQFFQSIGRATPSIILNLTRQLLLFIPLLLLLPRLFGMDGIFLSQPISDAITAIISAVLLNHALRNLPADKPLSP